VKLRCDKIIVTGGGSGIGATFTPMIARYAKNIDDPYPRHAIGRFIRPDEIAELAYYLMSDYGEIICGHTVVADGGDRAATL
jgi:NAD(P)-dependent dehydrogenase (short-subunit alcohol dehydrogenase family)